jgi:hypothetical protein
MSRRIEKSNLPLFDESVGSGPPCDEHIVRAPLAKSLRGEPPANSRAVNNIEIHRRALVLQLSEAREFFEMSCEMAHDVMRYHVLNYPGRLVEVPVGKKTGVYGNIQTSAANSDTWQITKAAILTGYPVLR